MYVMYGIYPEYINHINAGASNASESKDEGTGLSHVDSEQMSNLIKENATLSMHQYHISQASRAAIK
jgi:hypothetical protein